MPGEGQDDVEKIQPDEEGKIPPTKEGKYPEVVSWTQYVGVKEKLGREKQELQEKVASLEEQLKTAINAEEYQKVKEELESIKAEHQKTAEELKGVQERSASEMRDFLKSKGVSDEELEGASMEDLKLLVKVIGSYKPKPDLGTGGGSGELKGSPMELARQAYEQSSK